MSVGTSIRVFLADGTPGGLRTAEIMNWIGHVVDAQRSDLVALSARPEAIRTGIYILLGDDPDSLGGQLAYIGEGDVVRKRLGDHARPESKGGKDFWDRAIVLTSKDTNLTKAHARYLESRFITLALQADRVRLTNDTTPPPIALPEADVSYMENFIDQAKIVLPVLGVNMFRSPRIPLASAIGTPADSTDSPLFEMSVKKWGISATAREVDGEFTVLEGSSARLEWTGVEGSGYDRLRAQLEQDGTLASTTDGSAMHFTRNHVFASPSAAAAVVAGRSANGRSEWQIQGTRRTYGQWETEGVEEAMRAGGDE